MKPASSTHPGDDALAELARSATSGTTAGSPDIAAHVTGCAQCGARLSDFERLYAHVRRAPRAVPPPDDLWPGLRARLAALPVEPAATQATRFPWPRAISALAAAVLLAVAGTTLARRQPPPAIAQAIAPTVSAPTNAPEGAEVQAEAVEQQLLSELELQRGRMRPETAAEVDANLRVIDSAITELQAALAREPGNGVVRELLAESHARKTELLRQTQNAS